MKKASKWFHYDQNNSGGYFHHDPFALIVEAENHIEANRIAKEHIYFDGCAGGKDCPCCGDRWSEQYDSEVDQWSVFATKDEAIDHAKERKYGYEASKSEIRVVPQP